MRIFLHFLFKLIPNIGNRYLYTILLNTNKLTYKHTQTHTNTHKHTHTSICLVHFANHLIIGPGTDRVRRCVQNYFLRSVNIVTKWVILHAIVLFSKKRNLIVITVGVKKEENVLMMMGFTQ